MTVIRRQQQSYKYPNSNQASDTESLNLGGSIPASDTESVTNEPESNTRYRHPANIIKNFEENFNLKKQSGKRRIRRYQNRCNLQTLCEEEDENDSPVLWESCKGPLTRLVENDMALEYWNEFIEKSEEDQNKILESLNIKYGCKNCNQNRADKPFSRISSKIRRTLKIRRNLSLDLVKASEDDVIYFFKATPEKMYTKNPPTSFERLLTHAIAQYHSLHSTSIWKNEKRCVEILNFTDNWAPAECCLYDFIAQIRN